MSYREILSALGDEQRRQVLMELKRGRLSAGELASALGTSPQALSYHLSKQILNVLTLLPFLAAAVALCLAPDEIPGHWNASGKADRMGSKWEVLIWPVLVLLTRLGMAGLTKLVRTKDKNGAANATFLEHSTMVVLAVFDFLSLYFMRAAVNQEFDVERYNRSVWQISMALTGASLIPVGTQMPKLKLNSTSGAQSTAC